MSCDNYDIDFFIYIVNTDTKGPADFCNLRVLPDSPNCDELHVHFVDDQSQHLSFSDEHHPQIST